MKLLFTVSRVHGVKYPVLEFKFKEKNQTIAIVQIGLLDFFQNKKGL
jgi:hypothetical protein